MLSLSENLNQRLKVALNDCIRFIYNIRLGEHVTHLQPLLLGVPFSNYYKYRSVIFIHKLIMTRKPNYLYQKLNISNIQTSRLVLPINRTAFYNASFFVRGISTYNSLPNYIKRIASIPVFGDECRKYFNS